MGNILALDVSTSCTGICVYDEEAQRHLEDGTPLDHHVRWLDRVEFKGCKTFWDKADRVEEYLRGLEQAYTINRVALEEPLMGFRPGMSSAQTISQLLRFNGIVSNLARKQFGAVPEYISANHARKVAGIKLQRTAVAGMSQKEQVFKHMSEGPLKGFAWPLKKDGSAADWSRDATDAYVIAVAAAHDGMPTDEAPVKRPRKSKKAAAV